MQPTIPANSAAVTGFRHERIEHMRRPPPALRTIPNRAQERGDITAFAFEVNDEKFSPIHRIQAAT